MKKLKIAILASALIGISALAGCSTFIQATSYNHEKPKGELATGKVHWVLTTLDEKKSKMIGFEKAIPAAYQDKTWAYVRFHNYAYLIITYAWAIVPPGMTVKDGDTVELAYGTRNPYTPNRITRVLSQAQ